MALPTQGINYASVAVPQPQYVQTAIPVQPSVVQPVVCTQTGAGAGKKKKKQKKKQGFFQKYKYAIYVATIAICGTIAGMGYGIWWATVGKYKCHCEFGTAADGHCPDSYPELCLSCYYGYSLDTNTYQCVSDTQVDTPTTTTCESYGIGYYLIDSTCITFTFARKVAGSYLLQAGEYYATAEWVGENYNYVQSLFDTDWDIVFFKEFLTNVGDSSERDWNPTWKLDGAGYGWNFYAPADVDIWDNLGQRLVMYN